MSSTTDPAGEAGFTLLESVVAAAILALALGAFFAASSNALHTASAIAKRTEAMLEARSLLDRLGTELPLASGRFEGETPAGRAYRLDIAPIRDPQAKLGAFEVHLVLRARAKDPAALASLSTIRVAEAHR
ncbi:MAG: prepilin-type N-terminal cleavage/methylation domain-containing protein [Alphaproteobacteria bacterium]